MISVANAIDLTLKNTPVLEPVEVDLPEASGAVLAEDIVSDIHMPPFDKSSMDGYAVRAEDCGQDGVVLQVVGVIPAGTYPGFELKRGQAAKIMTGAPLPAGADSVQKVELSEGLPENKVRFLEGVEKGKNVALKGEIMADGTHVFHRGVHVSPGVVGVLATVGRHRVKIHRRPRVAILVTGDELVEVAEKPGPGQIRNSNGHTIFAQVRETGAEPFPLGIASDDVDDLTTKISTGLRYDVLLICGGVSMGDYDLVEDVLAGLGVEKFFDKVNIKPGKPTVFGKTPDTLVFGLPGNPVSASTIFELFVRPAVRKMMGFTRLHNLRLQARLERDHHTKTKREYYHPAVCYFEDNTLYARPNKTKGSADVLSFAKSNAYIVTPSGSDVFSKGDLVEVMLRSDFWKDAI